MLSLMLSSLLVVPKKKKISYRHLSLKRNNDNILRYACSYVDSTYENLILVDLTSQIYVQDLAGPAKTKGRPKIVTKIKPGLGLTVEKEKDARVFLEARRFITRLNIQRRRCKREMTFDGF